MSFKCKKCGKEVTLGDTVGDGLCMTCRSIHTIKDKKQMSYDINGFIKKTTKTLGNVMKHIKAHRIALENLKLLMTELATNLGYTNDILGQVSGDTVMALNGMMARMDTLEKTNRALAKRVISLEMKEY